MSEVRNEGKRGRQAGVAGPITGLGSDAALSPLLSEGRLCLVPKGSGLQDVGPKGLQSEPN